MPNWNFLTDRCLKIRFCFLLLERSLRGNASIVTQISV